MVTFRNNNNGRRNNFRRSDRSFKSNTDRVKFSSNFSNGDNFQRKVPGSQKKTSRTTETNGVQRETIKQDTNNKQNKGF